MELPKLIYRTPEYVITDFTEIPDFILQFKKHFTSTLKERDLPPSIHSYYFPNNKSIFQYLTVSGKLSNPIPVPREAISELLSGNKTDRFSYIQNYQSGFLLGFKSFSDPFKDILVIDTPENRKDLIIKTISMGISSFPAKLIFQHKDFLAPSTQENFSPDEFFEFGEKVGQVYKAWYYILQSPRYFENDITELIKKENSNRVGVFRPSQKKRYQNYLNLLKQSEEPINAKNLVSPKETTTTNKLIFVKTAVTEPNHTQKEIIKENTSPQGLLKEPEELKDRQKNTKALLKEEELGEISPIQLKQFFKKEAEYDMIMDILAKEGHINPRTYIWNDEVTGNKGFLAMILKYLHQQGYYKDDKKLKAKEIKEISKNTFGWEMSKSTIDKVKFRKGELSFIPVSSTKL